MWMWNLLAKITCQFKPGFQLPVNMKLSNHVTSDNRHVLNTYFVPGRIYQYSINKVQRSEIMTYQVQSFRSLVKAETGLDFDLICFMTWLNLKIRLTCSKSSISNPKSLCQRTMYEIYGPESHYYPCCIATISQIRIINLVFRFL